MSFSYTAELIGKLERTISLERLEKYVSSTNGDRAAALQLYARNTRISEAFYTPLQGIEVCLRNAINAQLSKGFRRDWYDDGAVGLTRPLPEMISKAKQSLRDDGKNIEPGRMVAELNFGFWVGILGPRYETALWRTHLRHSFPNRPRGFERKQIQNALNAIRRLRNRVFHHEPILHRNLRDDFNLICAAIDWMCPDTRTWVSTHSRTLAEISI